MGYFAAHIESEMDKAEARVSRGKKTPRKEVVERARNSVLERYGILKAQARKFADPASMF